MVALDGVVNAQVGRAPFIGIGANISSVYDKRRYFEGKLSRLTPSERPVRVGAVRVGLAWTA